MAVFDQEQITQKKTVLTPVVRKGTIAVIDCNMNTIVSRDPCDIGKVMPLFPLESPVDQLPLTQIFGLAGGNYNMLREKLPM